MLGKSRGEFTVYSGEASGWTKRNKDVETVRPRSELLP